MVYPKTGKKLQVADCGGRARNGWWNVDTVFNEARSNAGANGSILGNK